MNRFSATLTAHSLRTGETKSQVVEFPFYPKALVVGKLAQAFTMSAVVSSTLVSMGFIRNSDLFSITHEGNLGTVRAVREGVPYNNEQVFSPEEMDIVALVTLEIR